MDLASAAHSDRGSRDHVALYTPHKHPFFELASYHTCVRKTSSSSAEKSLRNAFKNKCQTMKIMSLAILVAYDIVGKGRPP
jgi:hypothetical protein